MKKIVVFGLLILNSLAFADQRQLRIGIIGGGPAGLMAAYELKKAGYTDVVVLEKNAEVGGKTMTIDLDGRSFEMGAIMSGPSYEEVIKLAKAFGEKIIPFSEGGAPVVEAESKKSEMKAMPTTKQLSFLAAAIEYHFIYNKYKDALSQPGLSKIPAELNIPFAEWAKKNSKFHKELIELLSHSFVSFGYGRMSEVPAAYVLRYFSPRLLRSFMFGQVHMLENGYQNLWKKVAKSLSVKTSFAVEKASHNEKGWTIESKTGEQLQFDNLIWTAPLDELGKKADISQQLKVAFSQIRYQSYYSTLVEVEGLSKGSGVLTKNYEPKTGAGNLVSWLYRWPTQSNMVNFYTLADEGLSPDKVESEIREFAASHNFRINCIVKNVGWRYFPHFKQESLDRQVYEKIESEQGRRGLYMAGELMNFSTVEHTSEYSKELVQRFFVRSGQLSQNLPENYLGFKAKEKLKLLWENILQTEYKVPPSYKQFGGNAMKDILGFFPAQLSKAFSNNNDVILSERGKIIHKLGSVATIRFEAADGGYQDFDGLIRLSNAVDGSTGIMYPSFSVKIPMDNNDRSINFNIGKSFDGQRVGNDFKDGTPDFNFFRDDKKYPFSNELPNEPRTPVGKAFKWVFDWAHLTPNYISVNELSKVMNKPAPRRFVFRAPEEIRSMMPSDHYTDERAAFAKIEAGSVLFDVFESTGLNDPGKFVGRLRTTSRFVSSSFGDRNLYFRHEARGVKKSQPEFSQPKPQRRLGPFKAGLSCQQVF